MQQNTSVQFLTLCKRYAPIRKGALALELISRLPVLIDGRDGKAKPNKTTEKSNVDLSCRGDYRL